MTHHGPPASVSSLAEGVVILTPTFITKISREGTTYTAVVK